MYKEYPIENKTDVHKGSIEQENVEEGVIVQAHS